MNDDRPGANGWITTETVSLPLKGTYKCYEGNDISYDSIYVSFKSRLEMINENPNEKIVNIMNFDGRWIIVTEEYEDNV